MSKGPDLGSSIDWGTSIALGMCLGIIVGLMFDEPAMGIAMGPLFGIVLHGLRRKKDTPDGDKSKTP